MRVRWIDQVLLFGLSGPRGVWGMTVPAVFGVSTFLALAAPIGHVTWLAWGVCGVTAWWMVSRTAEFLYYRDLVRRFDNDPGLCPFCGYPAPEAPNAVCPECGERPSESVERVRRSLGQLSGRKKRDSGVCSGVGESMGVP